MMFVFCVEVENLIFYHRVSLKSQGKLARVSRERESFFFSLNSLSTLEAIMM